MPKEVALTRIAYGAKSKREPDGSFTELQATQYVEVGEELPSGFEGDKDALRNAGALGDPRLLPVAEATSAILQSAEALAMNEGDKVTLGGMQAPTAPPTEEDKNLAHRIRTDEVLRAEGGDAEKAIAEEEKAADKAAADDAKVAAKAKS